MPPDPPRNAQLLRRARDMSSTCAWRPLLVLHNFPFFSLLLSIMPGDCAPMLQMYSLFSLNVARLLKNNAVNKSKINFLNDLSDESTLFVPVCVPVFPYVKLS